MYHLWNVLAGGSSLYILGILAWVYLVTITIDNVILTPQLVRDDIPVLSKRAVIYKVLGSTISKGVCHLYSAHTRIHKCWRIDMRYSHTHIL